MQGCTHIYVSSPCYLDFYVLQESTKYHKNINHWIYWIYWIEYIHKHFYTVILVCMYMRTRKLGTIKTTRKEEGEKKGKGKKRVDRSRAETKWWFTAERWLTGGSRRVEGVADAVEGVADAVEGIVDAVEGVALETGKWGATVRRPPVSHFWFMAWKRNWPDSPGDSLPRRSQGHRKKRVSRRLGWVNNCYIGDGCLITFSFTL